MSTSKEQKTQEPAHQLFGKEAEIAFLKWIKDKGKVTVTDVVTWEDRENGISFAPGLDGLKVLGRYVNMGVLGFNKEYEVVYRGFTGDPEPAGLLSQPEP